MKGHPAPEGQPAEQLGPPRTEDGGQKLWGHSIINAGLRPVSRSMLEAPGPE